jgi:FkbM family methyltransferase
MNDDMKGISEKLDVLQREITDLRKLVGPFGVPMPGDQILVQTIHGTKYLIDAHDLIMTPHMIIYRQWEAELSQFTLSRINRDTHFVDVGANFGYFTCLAGSAIGTSGSGRVIAIEPNPKLVRLMRANCLINWSMSPIDIHQVAMGDVEKLVQLWIPASKAANASLTTLSGDAESIDVALRPLDAIIPPGFRVDLLKIDVEGHEAGVLRGAQRVISDSPDITIIMEWSLCQMVNAGITSSVMVMLLRDLGLKTYRVPALGEDHYQIFPYEELVNTGYANIILRQA